MAPAEGLMRTWYVVHSWHLWSACWVPETTERLPFAAPRNHDVGPVLIPALQPGKLPKGSEEAAEVP